MLDADGVALGLKPTALLLLALTLLLGCRKPQRTFLPKTPIILESCHVTERDQNGNALSCSCGHFVQGVDKDDRLVAICTP
jgi:hypothetical protein